MFRKVFKNITYLYISQIISNLLYLIQMVFISRTLGVEGLGQYAASFAISAVFFIFVNAGFDDLFIRKISINKEKTGDYLLEWGFIKCSIWFLGFFLIFWMLNEIESFNDIKQSVFVLTVSVFLGSFIQMFRSVLIAHERMKDVMSISILRDGSVTGLVILALRLGGNLIHVIFCFVIAEIIAFIYGLMLMHKLRIKLIVKISFKSLIDLGREGFPFFISSMFLVMLFRIDIIMLKIFYGNYEAGLYSAAYSFLKSFSFFPVLFMLAVYPVFSRIYMDNKVLSIKLYRKFCLYLLFINVFVLVTLFVFAKVLILLVLGKEYVQSIIILRYAIIAGFFLFQNMSNYYFLNAIGNPDLNAWILGSGLIINISLNLLLIPNFSYYGVLMAISVSYVFIFSLSMYVVSKKVSECA